MQNITAKLSCMLNYIHGYENNYFIKTTTISHAHAFINLLQEVTIRIFTIINNIMYTSRLDNKSVNLNGKG